MQIVRLAHAALVVWLVSAPATVRGQPAAHDASHPIILVVHGRGQVGRDTAEVRREAWRALAGSMRAVDADVSLDEEDVRLAWYADVLDAHSLGGATGCVMRQSDSIVERESVPSALSMVAMLASAFLDVAMTDASAGDATGLRSISGDLRYLADRDTRCAAESRVDAALRQARRDGRPVILISHSLGALVSWGELMRAGSDTALPPIRRWITVGSPLGSIELRQLILGDDRALTVPPSVRSWANVVGRDDPFSVRIGDGGRADSPIQDVLTESAHDDPHQLTSYLEDPATARLVLSVWRLRHE